MQYFSKKTIYFIFYFFKKKPKTKPLTGWQATHWGGWPANIWSRGWPSGVVAATPEVNRWSATHGFSSSSSSFFFKKKM